MAGKTIEFSGEARFLKESGKMFLSELAEDAAQPGAPEQIRADWKTVADWLGATALTSENSDRLSKAWIAYLAIGLAPSFKLQSAFDDISTKIGNVPASDRPPTEVMRVFDRMLATDAEIKAKRAADWKAEEERLRPILAELKGEKRPNWWRRQPAIVRNWIFASIVWGIGLTVYAIFFEPFGGYVDDDEMGQFLLLLSAPVAAGAVIYAHHRWVR